MAELKTKLTTEKPADFLNTLTDKTKQQDSFTLLALMQEITGQAPKMWGSSIIGFGSYGYEYKSGQAGEWFLTGFSPRKQNLTLYLMSGFTPLEPLLQKLGKYKTSKGCLYIKKLADVNVDVLREIIALSVSIMKGK